MKHTEENGVPGLTVDIKKQRLRINRNTFRQMDNPIYFRLLVNPDAKGLVIEACTEADVGSYHVSKLSANNGSAELYSRELVKEIMICAGFTGLTPIRLYGRPIKERCAIFFRLEPDSSVAPAESKDNKGQRYE